MKKGNNLRSNHNSIGSKRNLTNNSNHNAIDSNNNKNDVYNRQQMKSPYGKNKASQQSSRNTNIPTPPAKNQQQQRGVNINKNQKQNYDNTLQQSNASSQGHAYDAINNLIHEYLLKHGMQKTLDYFQDEIFEKPKNRLKGSSYETELINAFNKGNRDEFFSKWIKFIPVNIRFKDERANKLEFYLQVYFLVYNIHPKFKKANSISKEAIDFFKEYLETRGQELAKTSEFLHFYALPYIIKPSEHPSLKQIFTETWVLELQQKLSEFLYNLYPNEQVPLLFHVYTQYLKNNMNNNSGSYDENTNANTNINNNNNAAIDNGNTQKKEGEGNREKYIAQLEHNSQELINILNTFNNKYTNLQENYKQFAEQAKQNLIESQRKWFKVAQDLVMISKDLLKMVDDSSQGTAIQENVLKTIVEKLNKYEQFLNANLSDLMQQNQEIPLFENTGNNNNSMQQPDQYQEGYYPLASPMQQQASLISQEDQQNMEMDNQQMFNNNINTYVQLDYEKIKQIIVQSQNPSYTCLVLQALRWRITKTKGAYIRREIVIAYALYDIIGCKPENQNLQIKMLEQVDDRTKELSLRLINYIASDFYGRSYLVDSEILVKRLINILQQETSETIIRKNALGALQKLSLRRKPQIVMIENELIQWIVKTLKEEKYTLSEYSYEYATALFMNLSLRSLGKTKCQDPEQGVLKVLNELLEHENLQVRTFVNGTLYSLLSRQSLREQAKAMGMNDILSHLKDNSDERFKKQIQYIMDQLNKKETEDDDAISETPDEDNDVDDIDEEEDIGEEEDQNDVIENVQGMQFGEQLLQNEFVAGEQQALIQENSIRAIVQEEQEKRRDLLSQSNNNMAASNNNNMNINQSISQKQDRYDIPFNRPTTPSLSLSQISNNNQMYNHNYQHQQHQIHQNQMGHNNNNQQQYNNNNQYQQQQQNHMNQQMQNMNIQQNQSMLMQNSVSQVNTPNSNQQSHQQYHKNSNNNNNNKQQQPQQQQQNNDIIQQQQQFLEQQQYASMQKQAATSNQLKAKTSQNSSQHNNANNNNNNYQQQGSNQHIGIEDQQEFQQQQQQQQEEEDNKDYEQQQKELERNLPSELQSRPKIARTPLGQQRNKLYNQYEQEQEQEQQKDNQQQQQEQISQQQQVEKEEENIGNLKNNNSNSGGGGLQQNQQKQIDNNSSELQKATPAVQQQNQDKQEEQNDTKQQLQDEQDQKERQNNPEFDKAFGSRPLIVRTPPNGERVNEQTLVNNSGDQQNKIINNNSSINDYY